MVANHLYETDVGARVDVLGTLPKYRVEQPHDNFDVAVPAHKQTTLIILRIMFYVRYALTRSSSFHCTCSKRVSQIRRGRVANNPLIQVPTRGLLQRILAGRMPSSSGECKSHHRHLHSASTVYTHTCTQDSMHYFANGCVQEEEEEEEERDNQVQR
jgi:hypothetical protein